MEKNNRKSKKTSGSSDDDSSIKHDDDESTEGGSINDENSPSRDNNSNNEDETNNETRDGTTTTTNTADTNTTPNMNTTTTTTTQKTGAKDHNPSSNNTKDNNRDSSKDRGGGNETSDEDEVVNYPNQPPIQNGFIVFIHQLNLATTAKEKRTVVEWISDALKMLDIHPETITVDKLIDQSITQVSKPKVPVIKFSRPTGKNQKQNEELEANAPSFRFRTKNRKNENDHSVKSDFVSDNSNNTQTKAPKPATKLVQSKKKINRNEKTKSGSVAPAPNSIFGSWKGGKVIPQKSVNSTSSKGLQRKSVRPAKPQVIEDKKQEYGVQLSVLREKCRTMQIENNKSVWVLLVESRRRCIVDMAKLNSLATKFRFKVRWIAAQTPRSLDQSVFNVVNDIVQTKNICFPEQMKAALRKDKESKVEGKTQGKSGKQQGNTSKGLHVEVLHRTRSAQFDVHSFASFDIAQIMEKVANDPVSPSSNDKKKHTQNNDNDNDNVQQDENAPTTTLKNSNNFESKTEKSQINEPNTEDSYESFTTKSTDSSSQFDIRSSNKNYSAMYNTAVQIALTSGNINNNNNNNSNPFSSIYMKSENPIDLSFLADPNKTEEMEQEHKAKDVNGNHVLEQHERNSKSMIVVIRDLKKSGKSMSIILKRLLQREGIRNYTISVSNLFKQPKAVELMEHFAFNSGFDSSRDHSVGCKILIQNGLKYKLAEKRSHVIIVDVEDESFVRMWSIYNYGIKLGYKCLVLEKKLDGNFETNLKKVFQTIRRRFKASKRLQSNWPSLKQLTTSISSGQIIFKPEKLERLIFPCGTTVNSENAVNVAKSLKNLVKANKLKLSLEGNEKTSSNNNNNNNTNNCVVVTEVKNQDSKKHVNNTKSCTSDPTNNTQGAVHPTESYSWLTIIEDDNDDNNNATNSPDSTLNIIDKNSDMYKTGEKQVVLAIEQGHRITGKNNNEDNYKLEEVKDSTKELNITEENNDPEILFSIENLDENDVIYYNIIRATEAEDAKEEEEEDEEDGYENKDEEDGEIKSLTNSRNMDLSDDDDDESSLPTDYRETHFKELCEEASTNGTDDNDNEDENDNRTEKVSQNLVARSKKQRGLSKLINSKNKDPDLESNELSTDDEAQQEGTVENGGKGKTGRKNLLEIHRYKSRDDTTVTVSSASEEELFKGWVAYPQTNSKSPGYKTEHGCFSRTHTKLSAFFSRMVCCAHQKSESKISSTQSRSTTS